jgi:RNA polymerase sigma-70 factor, ECF subfamily
MSDDRSAEFLAEALPHMQPLHRFAFRWTRDPGAAEDLVQETYCQAWRSFDRYRTGTNCRAWLYRILLNLIWAERRKLARARIVAIEEAPELALSEEPELPEVFGREHVLAAFESLPESQRVILQLADVDGLRYREVAEVLSVPLGTVMSRLSRARGALRLKLAERLGTGAGA